MVSPGTKVSEGQPVMELETDKAVVEVPSSVSGVVKELKVKEGEKVKVGQVIFTLEGGVAGVEPARPRTGPVEHVSGQHGARLAFQAAIRAEGKTEEQALPPDQPQQAVAAFSMPAQLGKVAGTEHRQAVPAAPHVRRLAREIGVDIYEVKGSGPGGRISEDDVKGHAKALVTAASAHATPQAGHFRQPQLPDFGKWGKIERVSMRGVRRKTAEHLAEAWNTIPHVTQHDRADITELEQLRARFAPKAEEAGGKMTVTAIALKVCAAALKVFPQFNASIDIEKEEIVYKQYINIGVAADTDRGLLVPVIRDVEKKNIVELAVELSQLSKKARDKKLTPADMEGGTFTITNLGGIGGVGFTPIVNFPEVAILGLSRSRMEPEWIQDKDGGKFEPRLILPLSLSYDHRLIDGADAARFLRWIAEAFEQPFLLSVQG
jgi:pyruvate dehydrogenase E2 component (dihydrolipoamide acetyltransferase)